MAISAADVNKLRKQTGAGMMDCKKALTETNGDFEAAVDFLRKKGQKVSASRSDRETTEGVVIARTNSDETRGIVIGISCETDFVAKNDAFIQFASSIADVAIKGNVNTAEEVLALDLNGTTVQDAITDQIGKIGEKIEVSSFHVESAEKVVSYIHANNKLGVLVAMSKAGNGSIEAAGKDVAMQIAAMKPVALDKDAVDSATIEREIEIAKDVIRAEGKPEAMIEKIALGKLNKFFKDNTLLNQQFVKDSSKTVKEMLAEVDKDLNVVSFKRVEIG
ncbi:MAG: elongation factor Ts [Sphingobacteriales bacterium]|jgi:elongation factor Ts